MKMEIIARANIKQSSWSGYRKDGDEDGNPAFLRIPFKKAISDGSVSDVITGGTEGAVQQGPVRARVLNDLSAEEKERYKAEEKERYNGQL
ncbi:hypothetical protein Tco_1524599 [Tanacetum coccineum]